MQEGGRGEIPDVADFIGTGVLYVGPRLFGITVHGVSEGIQSSPSVGADIGARKADSKGTLVFWAAGLLGSIVATTFTAKRRRGSNSSIFT